MGCPRNKFDYHSSKSEQTENNTRKLCLPIANRHSANELWQNCRICRDIERQDIDLAALSPPLRRRSTTQILRLFRYAFLHNFHGSILGNLNRQYTRMRHTTGSAHANLCQRIHHYHSSDRHQRHHRFLCPRSACWNGAETPYKAC